MSKNALATPRRVKNVGDAIGGEAAREGIERDRHAGLSEFDALVAERDALLIDAGSNIGDLRVVQPRTSFRRRVKGEPQRLDGHVEGVVGGEVHGARHPQHREQGGIRPIEKAVAIELKDLAFGMGQACEAIDMAYLGKAGGEGILGLLPAVGLQRDGNCRAESHSDTAIQRRSAGRVCRARGEAGQTAQRETQRAAPVDTRSRHAAGAFLGRNGRELRSFRISGTHCFLSL